MIFAKEKEAARCKDEIIISIAIMSPAVILMLQYLILSITAFSMVQIISKAIVGLIFIFALPAVLRRSKATFLLVYLFFIVLYFTQYVIFPGNRIYLIRLLVPFFVTCLPALIYSMSIKDFGIFGNIMKSTSILIFLAGVFYTILVLSGNLKFEKYSMSFSYYMLLPSLVFLNDMFDDFTIKSLAAFFLSILAITALGSRGPLLSIAAYIILKFGGNYFLLKNEGTSKRQQLFNIVFLLVIVFGLIFMNEILVLLNDGLQNLGISSRTLNLFSNTNGIYDSGRSIIYNRVFINISEQPLLGLGIAGDRKVLKGAYVHNLFLETLANFGLLLGTIIVIGLLIFIFLALIKSNKKTYEILILWLCLGAVPLLVSRSYWEDINFWIFMGLTVNINLKKRSQYSLNTINNINTKILSNSLRLN